MNKLYVILLNYNNWEDTIECLESLLRNDYENFQVIVVDNASPNNSMEYLTAWARGEIDVSLNPEHPLRKFSYPPIQKPLDYIVYTEEIAKSGGLKEEEEKLRRPIIFIQSGKNGGFAKGNNIAINYAIKKGDFDSIILLNNDTVVAQNFISEMVKLREDALYGCRIMYYDKPDVIWYDGGSFNSWLGWARHIHYRINSNKLHNNDGVRKVNFVTFCAVMIPKGVLEKFGLLDEDYFMYVEDVDYSYRVYKGGHNLYHLPKPLVWHKVSKSGGGELSEFSTYWAMRSRLKLINKRLSGIRKISALSFILLSRIPRYILTGNTMTQLRTILRATYDEFRNV